MSDEFSKAAEKEIKDELEANSQILQSCNNDTDIEKNGAEIEKHLHKLKGLAPMMNQKEIGEIASLNDSLIKKILDGKKIKGIFETITESNKIMKNLMHDSSTGTGELKQSIKTKHSEFLD